MEMEFMALAKMMGPWVFAGGAAWGGIKVGLNGQKEQLAKVSNELDAHVEVYHKDARKIVKTLSSLETKVDLLIEHKIKE